MAVKMQRELEGQFNTVFIESQGATPEAMETFALNKEWLGTSAAWTNERPFETGARGIPNFVLLSSDGEVVLKGNPISMHKEIEEYIKGEKKRRSRAPDDLPKDLSSAWKAIQKGEFADAAAEAEKAAQSNEAVGEVANALIEDAKSRAASCVDRAARMIEAGHYSDAEDVLDEVVDELGDGEQATRAQDLLAKLKSKDLEDEIKAEKAFAKLEKKMFTKGFDKGTKRGLEKFAEKHAGTKAADRAARWAGMLDA